MEKIKNKYAVPLTPYAPGGDLGVNMTEGKQIKSFEEILNSKLSTGGLKANYVFGNLHFKEICEAAEEYKNQFSSPQEVTDEEISQTAVQLNPYSIKSGTAYYLIERGIVIGMQAMRSKLTNK